MSLIVSIRIPPPLKEKYQEDKKHHKNLLIDMIKKWESLPEPEKYLKPIAVSTERMAVQIDEKQHFNILFGLNKLALANKTTLASLLRIIIDSYYR